MATVEAIGHLNDCIKLNPNDNQGLRYKLLHWLLVINDLISASEFVSEKPYGENSYAFLNFSQSLYLFKKFGNFSNKFISALKNAHRCNPYVIKYLTGELRIPKTEPEHYSLGSKEEAIIYATLSIEAWKDAPELISILKDLK